MIVRKYESTLQWVGEMNYNYGIRHKNWRWFKENIQNSYGNVA